MFDNVGKDLDQERHKRRAASFIATFALIGLVGGIALVISARKIKEVVMEAEFAEEMIEVAIEEAEDLEAPPPPPPPPPPPAAAEAEEEEEEDEDDEPEQPDDMVEEVKELKEEVKKEMKSDKKPAGVEGGQEGGVEGGVVGGVQGGIVGGVVGGKLGGGGGPKKFNHRDLEVKKRVQPQYPKAARELNLGKQRCKATVFMDQKGVPYQVTVSDCPKVFHPTTKEAIMKWRWYPPKDGKTKVKAQTMIAVSYVLK